MPSESRTPTEPTREELSAYLDHELEAAAQARVTEHVDGCADCQARLDGLRQTAHAIRGLPMETPPRTFTVPAQSRREWSWAPVGWVGSLAAAMFVIVFGATHLHFSPAGGAATTAGGGANSAAQYRSAEKAVAPLAAPAASALDQHFAPRSGSAASNGSTVIDPGNGSRRLILETDNVSYPATGKMRVSVQLQGSPSSSTNSSDQGITLTLVHNGAGVALKPIGVESWNGTPIFGGWYDLRSLPLSGSRAGDYRLTATWVIPDGSGRVLQAEVPIQLTGS